ncbi:MAG: hypothetical protein ACTHJ5_14990 [Ilyomonas sp.]
MKILLVITIFFIMQQCTAQKTNAKNSSYFIPQVALLNGDNKVGGQLQVVGGYAIKKWGLGAGTALDYYKFRSVPVFADIRRSFGRNTHHPFAYVKFGYNIAWTLENQHYYYAEYQKSGNGWYADAGVGYELYNNRNKGFCFSAGFTAKTLSQTYKEYVYASWPQPPKQEMHKMDYTLRRLAIKIGYRF